MSSRGLAIRRPAVGPRLAASLWLALVALVVLALVADGHQGERLFAGAAAAGGLVAGGLVLWRVHPASALTAGLVLAIFSGNWSEIGLPSLLAPDRFCVALGLIGIAAPAAALGRRVPIRLGAAHVVMLVAAAFAICSAIAAGTLLSGGYLLLDRFGLIAFLVFTLTPYAFGDERHRTALLWALTGLGLYLGVTAIFEIVGPAALVFPRYINDSTVGIHFGRARGPFAEAATNGMALSTCGAAAAILTLRRTVGAKRLLSGAVLTLCALGVLLTLQRTAWLGAFAGVIVMMLSRAPLRRRLLAVLLAGALLVGAALVTIPGLAERAKTRGTDQETVWDRTNLARASIAMMLERPLTGFGWDRFHDESKPYFWQHGDTPLTASKGIPHNAILANAAELGVVGTVLWLLALALAVASALTARLPASALPWRDGLILLSIVVLALMLFTPMVSPFPLLALMLWAGVVRAQALGGKAS